MSGRARILHPDGRFTTYRKTMARRAPRTPAHKLPPWTLSFILPFELPFLGLTEGPYPGLIGVTIRPLAHVTVVGANRNWLTGQAEKLIRREAPDWVGEIAVHYRRAAEPHPTAISGPGHSPLNMTGKLIINRCSTQLLFGHSLRAFTDI